jgi:hypothetical protein
MRSIGVIGHARVDSGGSRVVNGLPMQSNHPNLGTAAAAALAIGEVARPRVSPVPASRFGGNRTGDRIRP